MSKKRKCSKAQLRALARGRKIRKQNINKGKRKGKRKAKSTRRSPKPKKRTYKRRNSTGGIDVKGGNMQMLTGGTGDVNPQFLSVRIGQSLRNTVVVSNFICPVARTKQMGNRVTVMEILKIWLSFHGPPEIGLTTASHNMTTYGAIYIGDQDHLRSFEHWSVLAQTYIRTMSRIVADSTYGFEQEMPYYHDLTDGAGHGVLVATDTMTIIISTSGYEVDVLNACEAKILYRFKNVGLTEYLGIVQSQQGK